MSRIAVERGSMRRRFTAARRFVTLGRPWAGFQTQPGLADHLSRPPSLAIKVCQAKRNVVSLRGNGNQPDQWDGENGR